MRYLFTGQAFTLLILIAFASCKEKTADTKGEMTAGKETVIKTAPPASAIDNYRQHADDGMPFFSVYFAKNNTVVSDFTSDKPLVFTGSLNMIVQLDSSHHLMVNGEAVNLYINAKTPGTYPVVKQYAGKDSATVILGFSQEKGLKPGYAPDKGTIVIEKMKDGLCSGYYECSSTEGRDQYLLKGQFQNAKIN